MSSPSALSLPSIARIPGPQDHPAPGPVIGASWCHKLTSSLNCTHLLTCTLSFLPPCFCHTCLLDPSYHPRLCSYTQAPELLEKTPGKLLDLSWPSVLISSLWLIRNLPRSLCP